MTSYHHHAWTGQSLADGVGTTGNHTTTARYPSNTFRNGSSAWAANIGDNPGTAIPDAIYAARLDGLAYTQSGDAAGGTSLANMSQGTNLYNNTLGGVTNGYNRATGAGDSFEVDAIHLIQGHKDMLDGTARAAYLTQLDAFRTAYETDINAITGQTESLLGVVSQSSAWINNGGVDQQPYVPLAQLDAHRNDPDWVLACADYASGGIGSIHQDQWGYAHLGEYHARAFLAGRDWQPLGPRDITITGRHIIAQYHVPTPPIVLDNTVHTPQANYGLGYTDDTSSASIESVQVRPDGRSILVTLDQEPTGANPMLGYGTLGTAQGGNIRDSDPSLSIADGAAIPNWGVLFLDPITPRRPRWSTSRASGLL